LAGAFAGAAGFAAGSGGSSSGTCVAVAGFFFFFAAAFFAGLGATDFFSVFSGSAARARAEASRRSAAKMRSSCMGASSPEAAGEQVIP
jgi:hypothetical protein